MNNLYINNFIKDVLPVQQKCINLFNLLNIEKKWNSKLFFELEIKKSYLKSVLRYSLETNTLQKNVLETLKLSFNEFGYTQFYPMLHLSGDRLEAGGFHYDQVDSKAIHTFWIAISDYEYRGLSVMPFNIQNNLINKLIIKSPIVKILSNNLQINKGDSFMWPGTLIHAGNYNSSENYSLAMQMKIVDKKNTFAFEKTKHASVVETHHFDSSNHSEEIELKDYKLFSKLIGEIVQISTKEPSLEENLIKIKKNLIASENIVNKRAVSFALSILSQRLTFSRKLGLPDSSCKRNLALAIDFASLVLGSENLISRKRILEHNSSLKFFLDSVLKTK
jgi:hypothetical protein